MTPNASDPKPRDMMIWPLTVMNLVLKRVNPPNRRDSAAADDAWKTYRIRILEILNQRGVEYIETTDHQIIAVAGKPMPDKSNVQGLVLAALEIRDWLDRMNKLNSENQYDFNIGIYTERVVAGIIAAVRMPYDLYSHALNEAARICQCSKHGTVTVSEYTHACLSTAFECHHSGGLVPLERIHKPIRRLLREASRNTRADDACPINLYEVRSVKHPKH